MNAGRAIRAKFGCGQVGLADPRTKQPSSDAVGSSLRTKFDGQRTKLWKLGARWPDQFVTVPSPSVLYVMRGSDRRALAAVTGLRSRWAESSDDARQRNGAVANVEARQEEPRNANDAILAPFAAGMGTIRPTGTAAIAGPNRAKPSGDVRERRATDVGPTGTAVMAGPDWASPSGDVRESRAQTVGPTGMAVIARPDWASPSGDVRKSQAAAVGPTGTAALAGPNRASPSGDV